MEKISAQDKKLRWTGILATALFFLLGVAATAAFLGHLANLSSLFEPDRLYHFAVLREAASQDVLVLRHWDQFPLLGWNDFYSDKEFLFHFLLALPFRIFGEQGAIYGAATFSALLAWLPFLFFRGRRFFALFLSLTLVLCHHYLLFRFSLLRPHTLAVLLFTLMLLLFFSGRHKSAGAAALLFNLAYHAFYLPLLACGLILGAAVLLRLSGRPAPGLRAGGAWIFAGCLLGLLLNPYFPANIIYGFQSLALGLRIRELQASLHLTFGGELQPRKISDFAREWLGPLLVMVPAFYLFLKRKLEPDTLLPAVFAGVFLAGAAASTRMVEYAAPVWAIFLVYALRESGLAARAGVLAFILLLQAPALASFVSSAYSSAANESPAPGEIRALLAAVKIAPGVRVYHDNWALGPYIAYELPSAEAIDVLDPTFLLLANPKLTSLRTVLNAGRLKDPASVIKQEFGANYALCEPTPLQRQLLASTGAKKIAESADHRFVLFQIL